MMVDPTSDHEENVDPEDAPDCTVCDESIVQSVEHRVVTWIDDGDVAVAHFCSTECRDTWNRED